jgi:hypothetical protein
VGVGKQSREWPKRSSSNQLYGIDAENREPPTNQLNNQQPSGREQPVDSRCLQSGSERIRVEWLHLVKRQLIMTRRLTSSEPKKVNKDLFSELAYEVRRGLIARSWSSRRAIWNEFGVDNQSFEWPMRSSSIQLRGIYAETANKPTQQPSSRDQPVDSHWIQSKLSDQSHAGPRHLVKWDLTVSSQGTNAERSKENTQTKDSQFLSSKCGAKLKVENRRVRIKWASANSLVKGRWRVPAFSCMESTPRTANQRTKQPSSRKHPLDSLLHAVAVEANRR